MADPIPDLWPDSISNDLQSPVAILRRQATLLGQKTGGLVICDISTSERGALIELEFELVAPALRNHRVGILSVRHDKELPFPASIYFGWSEIQGYEFGNLTGIWTRDDKGQFVRAVTQKEFVSSLGKALGSPRVVSLIQSMIVRSNETIVTR